MPSALSSPSSPATFPSPISATTKLMRTHSRLSKVVASPFSFAVTTGQLPHASGLNHQENLRNSLQIGFTRAEVTHEYRYTSHRRFQSPAILHRRKRRRIARRTQFGWTRVGIAASLPAQRRMLDRMAGQSLLCRDRRDRQRATHRKLFVASRVSHRGREEVLLPRLLQRDHLAVVPRSADQVHLRSAVLDRLSRS